MYAPAAESPRNIGSYGAWHTEKRGKTGGEGAWTVVRASDGANGPRDQPEWPGRRPNVLTALERDNAGPAESKPPAGGRELLS